MNLIQVWPWPTLEFALIDLVFISCFEGLKWPCWCREWWMSSCLRQWSLIAFTMPRQTGRYFCSDSEMFSVVSAWFCDRHDWTGFSWSIGNHFRCPFCQYHHQPQPSCRRTCYLKFETNEHKMHTDTLCMQSSGTCGWESWQSRIQICINLKLAPYLSFQPSCDNLEDTACSRCFQGWCNVMQVPCRIRWEWFVLAL